MRILLVDDEQDIAEEVADVLRRRRHTVITATGVHEACLAIEQDGPFDLIVTDLRLPAGTGVDVLRACDRGTAKPRMVVMTGEIEAAELQQVTSLGVSRVLAKPFSRRHLLDAVYAA